MKKITLVLLAAFLLSSPAKAFAADENAEKEITQEPRYKSTVEVKDSGVQLTDEEKELTSQLSSQIMRHVADARHAAAIRNKHISSSSPRAESITCVSGSRLNTVKPSSHRRFQVFLKTAGIFGVVKPFEPSSYPICFKAQVRWT
jgi:hypothetical protein